MAAPLSRRGRRGRERADESSRSQRFRVELLGCKPDLKTMRSHANLPCDTVTSDSVTVQYKAMGALLRHLDSRASLSLTPVVSSWVKSPGT